MKSYFYCFIILSALSIPAFSSGVYCDSYHQSGRKTGYSLYRISDNADLGNATFSTRNECDQSASVTNRTRADIACAKYKNNKDNTIKYSLYRIRDGKDLGKSTISSFQQCLSFVRSQGRSHSRKVFCSTYPYENQAKYSVYRLSDNKDLGNYYISSAESCNTAVLNAYDNLFCSPYSDKGLSLWNIETGSDVGTSVYKTMNSCISSYLKSPRKPDKREKPRRTPGQDDDIFDSGQDDDIFDSGQDDDIF